MYLTDSEKVARPHHLALSASPIRGILRYYLWTRGCLVPTSPKPNRHLHHHKEKSWAINRTDRLGPQLDSIGKTSKADVGAAAPCCNKPIINLVVG